jgi:putative ABC transport system permease protein
LKLVVVAILVATPFAWWAAHEWLQSFAYRVDPEWWTFGLSGLGAIVIATLSVGYQSIRAARQNPVKSLRTE